MFVRALRTASVLGWSAIAFTAMSVVAFAAGPRGPEWVSKDAVIYLEASHPNTLFDRVLDPKFQKYLSSLPPYARFLKSEAFKGQMAGVSFVASLLETTPEKGLRSLTGGGVVFAVEASPGKPPWGFVAFTPSDPAFLSSAHTKLLELARNDAKSKGKSDPIKESEYQGVKGYSMSDQEFHAIINDTLVISQSSNGLKAVIDRAKGKETGERITANADWKARKALVNDDTIAWGFVRLDRLRELDKKFVVPDQVNPGATFLFAPWIEAIRKAPWVGANLGWSDSHLTLDLALPNPPKGYSDALKRYLPPKGQGAAAPLNPPGTIASLTLWRDLSAIWEVRNELFSPQFVQGAAQLDTVAGQYFGGRDFGTGVLGSISNSWRLVVATQDYAKMNPVPDLRLPGFALVIDLKPDDDDFAQRLKVAFQSFIGLANIGAAQSKAPPLELVSEEVDGVTVASTRFMVSKPAPDAKKTAVHQRHNFSPTVVQVDNHFVLSSSKGLAKDLISIVREKQKPADATVLLTAKGSVLAGLLETNKARLVTQNMMEKGNDKAAASGEIDLLLGLLRYAGNASLSVKDTDTAANFKLDFNLGAK